MGVAAEWLNSAVIGIFPAALNERILRFAGDAAKMQDLDELRERRPNWTTGLFFSKQCNEANMLPILHG